MKFGINLEFLFKALLGVKGLKLRGFYHNVKYFAANKYWLHSFVTVVTQKYSNSYESVINETASFHMLWTEYCTCKEFHFIKPESQKCQFYLSRT